MRILRISRVKCARCWLIRSALPSLVPCTSRLVPSLVLYYNVPCSSLASNLYCPTQPLPNAFELFGADLLVSYNHSKFTVSILELNAEPAIELTGARLSWTLEKMFDGICLACIRPFFAKHENEGQGFSFPKINNKGDEVREGKADGKGVLERIFGCLPCFPRARHPRPTAKGFEPLADASTSPIPSLRSDGDWKVGETKWSLIKVLDIQVRGERGW